MGAMKGDGERQNQKRCLKRQEEKTHDDLAGKAGRTDNKGERAAKDGESMNEGGKKDEGKKRTAPRGNHVSGSSERWYVPRAIAPQLARRARGGRPPSWPPLMLPRRAVAVAAPTEEKVEVDAEDEEDEVEDEDEDA